MGGDICTALQWMTLVSFPYEMTDIHTDRQTDRHEVLDCDSFDGGCAGGDICTALQWMTLASFPYEMTDRQTQTDIHRQTDRQTDRQTGSSGL